MYAELHALTNFSFLRGASQPEELMQQAAHLGYKALAITDECSVAGVVRAHLAARQCGLPLIVGAEFTCIDGLKFAALATDRQGYGALCRLISRARRGAVKGRYHLRREDLEDALDATLGSVEEMRHHGAFVECRLVVLQSFDVDELNPTVTEGVVVAVAMGFLNDDFVLQP